MAIYNVNIWSGNRSRDELLKIRRSAAKAANERMVRLERGESLLSGEKLDSFGVIEQTREYLKSSIDDRRSFALSQGKKFREPKALRFSENLNQNHLENLNDIKKEIAEIQHFLNSKSSTVKGIHDIERKRIATFEENGITFASNKEFYDFFKADIYKDFVENYYSSETLVELYQSARELGKDGNPYSHREILEAMQDYREETLANKEKLTVKGLYEHLGIDFLPVENEEVEDVFID